MAMLGLTSLMVFGPLYNASADSPSSLLFENSSRLYVGAEKHLFANTLTEAVRNFADLTQNRQVSAVEDGNSVSDGLACSTESCRHCSGLLLQRLERIGMITHEELTKSALELNATLTDASTEKCKTMNFSHAGGYGQRHTRFERAADGSNVTIPNFNFNSNRNFTLSCIKAGELPFGSSESWAGLCDVCWSWRKLPEGHSPQYLNEVILGKSGKCLGGYGTCRKMYRNVDVALTTGSKTEIKTIPVIRSVECTIPLGSDFAKFVRGEADARLVIEPMKSVPSPLGPLGHDGSNVTIPNFNFNSNRSFTLKCIKAGELPFGSSESWAGLCDSCWSWRKLPEGYSPQFLNDVIPGKSRKCLGEYGTCRQMYRNFDVAVTTGSKTEIKTIPVARSVECTIPPGSDFAKFVRGEADARLVIEPMKSVPSPESN